ncbi:MAG TPA: ChbG/HpnK family deacetylase [Rhizomicrobium sp.]|nr:ChbG/HpnK family deacetylase [Rhizomicrobium sp.]
MERKRKVVLCADDYGLSPGVSRGIRELLQMTRLSATSCMVIFPEFAQDGPLLSSFLDKADIGLHFMLTADKSLRSVLIAGWLHRLNADEMRRELERQLGIFTAVMKRPPAYIDGHQHVHLLPGVREAVVEAAARIGAYVRVTHEPITLAMLQRPAPIDSAYLSRVSKPLARMAAERAVRTNSGFRGVRNFRERAPCRDLFRAMVAGAANGSIVMCHPGHADEMLATRDPIHRQREDEFAYLASSEFIGDMEQAGLRLARLRDTVAQAPVVTSRG